MNRVIPIKIRSKIATIVDRNSYYVCGNSDFKVVFDFDDDWEGLGVKTARFTYEGKYQDMVFEGDECPIPIITGTKYIDVGVFAGDLSSSTPARIRAKESIVDFGGLPEEPTPDVYAQVIKLCEEAVDTAKEVEKYIGETFPAVGKVYYEGETAKGEVFGDYETNAALETFTTVFGSGSTAGQKGYYMRAINFGDSTVIALSNSKEKVMPKVGVNMEDYLDTNFVSGFVVGDSISIMNNAHYQYCSSIIAINRNLITVKALPFSSIDKAGAADADDHLVFVPNKPRVGAVSFTTGGFAAGINVIAGGKGALACGRDTVAAGGGSLAAGRKTKAGYIATATGLSTSALGDCSFSANSYTLARGNSSTAFGAGTTADGLASFTSGSNTKAKGTGALAAGVNTLAEADATTSFGKDTKAQGVAAFASGAGTFAIGRFSFAANNGTVASGMASATFGMGTAAEGIASFASGSSTKAKGKNSFTWGEGTVADSDDMQAGGKYNLTTKDKILVYGNGLNNEARADAYTLDTKGNGWYAGNVEASEIILRNNGKKFRVTVSESGILGAIAI